MALTPEQLARMDADAAPAQPVGMTPEKFSQMDADAGGQGVFQRIGSDYDKRVGNLEKIAAADVAGKQTGAETMGQQAMQGLGMGVDAGTEAMKGLMDTAGQGLKVLSPGAYEGLQVIKHAVGSVAAPAAQAVAAKYREIVPDDTRLSRNLDAAGNLIGGVSMAAPLLKAAPAIGAVAGDVATAAKGAGGAVIDAVKGAPGAVNTALAPDIAKSVDAFSNGDKAYEIAKKAGTGVTSDAVDDFLTQAKKNGSQDPKTKSVLGDDLADKYLTALENLKGQPLSLETAQALDINMREQADKAFRAGDNDMGKRFKAIRQALRDHVYNQPDVSKVTGGPVGFEALQAGNKNYSLGYKLEKVENIYADGMTKDVPSTAIKNGFAKWAKEIRESGPQGLTADEVSAIESAGKTGVMTGFLKTMGSKLGPVAASVAGGVIGSGAGPIGAAAGSAISGAAAYAATAPFRAGATALQGGKAAAVSKAMLNAGKPALDAVTLEQLLKMSPKDALDYINTHRRTP